MLRHLGTKTIETSRLILRKFSESDISSAFRYWAGVEEIQTGYGEPTYDTPEKTAELLRSYIGRYESDEYYRWAVILRESGECIGQIALFLVNTKNEFCEIEYCIGKEFQGKGIATEATNAIIEFSIKSVGFQRVSICCRENNPASKRVIEKCGFVYEGALRRHFKCADGFHDRLEFSILTDEFDSIKEKYK